MNLKQINAKLQFEFAEKRIRAIKKAEANVAFLNKISAYKNLCALERELAFNVAKLESDNKPCKDKKDALKIVRQKKKEVLSKLKLTENDLKPKFECKLCEDTGFVGQTMCECFKKRRNEEFLKECGLAFKKDVTFENFDENICESIEQKNQLKKLKDVLFSWCEKFPSVSKKNIILSGEAGVGKTYLAECTANEIAKKGKLVCYVSAFDLNDMFLKYHTTFDGTKSAYLEPIISSDFLVVDDLGTEPLTKNVTLNYLYLVLSERERFNRPILITTNLSPENILDRYGERIYSRLFSKINGFQVKISGNDLRLVKSSKKNK